MTLFQKISLVGLRITLGAMMFYAGITKVLDPTWSPFGYLARAKTFPEFYTLCLDPGIIPYTTFFNAWGLTLVGAALILGFGVRIASVCGLLFMILYYFPVLEFPYVGEHAFLIDQHVIYAFGFLTLIAFGAGRVWSVFALLLRVPVLRKMPFIAKVLE